LHEDLNRVLKKPAVEDFVYDDGLFFNNIFMNFLDALNKDSISSNKIVQEKFITFCTDGKSWNGSVDERDDGVISSNSISVTLPLTLYHSLHGWYNYSLRNNSSIVSLFYGQYLSMVGLIIFILTKFIYFVKKTVLNVIREVLNLILFLSFHYPFLQVFPKFFSYIFLFFKGDRLNIRCAVYPGRLFRGNITSDADFNLTDGSNSNSSVNSVDSTKLIYSPKPISFVCNKMGNMLLLLLLLLLLLCYFF
jgi:hypothetical protein